MTTPDLCRFCKLQSFNLKEGIVCGLNSLKPEKGLDCKSFEKNQELVDKKFQDSLAAAGTEGIGSSTDYIGNIQIGRLCLILGIVIQVLFLLFSFILGFVTLLPMIIVFYGVHRLNKGKEQKRLALELESKFESLKD